MYVYSDITSDARVVRAAEALSGKYDVTVISTQYGKSVEDTCFRNILVGRAGGGRTGYPRTLWQALKIVRKELPDILYCHDYYSALLAYFLGSRKRCGKIVYDAHELIIPEPGSRMGMRQRFFFQFEKRIVHDVDLLVCASPERGERMKAFYRLEASPLPIKNISKLYVSHDSETDGIVRNLDPFFSRPGITVVYAGVVTRNRRIHGLVQAVSALAPGYKLLIVGAGDALEEVKGISASHPELVSAFTGKIPYKSLGAVLSRCDIGFIYYPDDSLNNRLCASNKVYEYASVGLPILSNDNPTMRRLLGDSHIGLSTDDFQKGLGQISADLEKMKVACGLFNDANPWSSEAARLMDAIAAMEGPELQSIEQ